MFPQTFKWCPSPYSHPSMVVPSQPDSLSSPFLSHFIHHALPLGPNGPTWELREPWISIFRESLGERRRRKFFFFSGGPTSRAHQLTPMAQHVSNLKAIRWSLSPWACVSCPQPKGKGREGPAPHSPDLVSPLRAAGISLAHTLVQVLVPLLRRPFRPPPCSSKAQLDPRDQAQKAGCIPQTLPRPNPVRTRRVGKGMNE